MLRFGDRPTYELANALTEHVMRDATKHATRELTPLLDRALREHGGREGEYAGEDAAHILKAAIDYTTSAVRAQAAGYNGLRWLWMLRRLPESMFDGDYTTTRGYDSSLAEVIAGQSTGQRSRIQRLDGDVRAYPLDDTVVKRLARYCEGTRFVSGLHRDYRWAGKGCSFEFRKGRLPERRPDEDLRKSVYLYDERVERGGGLGRMGTEVFEPNLATIDLRAVLRTLRNGPLTMFLRVVPIDPVDFPVPAPDADLTEDVPVGLVRARHMIMPVPLASLASLIAKAPSTSPPILDARAAALLFLMFASTHIVANHRAGFLSVLTTGYLQLNEPFLRTCGSEAFAITPDPIKTILRIAGVTSSDAALDLANAMKGNPWPLEAGPVLYRDEEALAIDLVAVGKRLADSVVFPRYSSELANIRGEHFELRVQDAIDRSRFAVPGEVRALRGRTLRLRGSNITDLDAIAQLDATTLLLVSCKSIIYSAEYDMGEARAIQNAASRVREGQEAWVRIVNTLRGNPQGDNYDLAGWTLLGVICTPTVVWTELGACTEAVVDGITSVVSLPELQEWLQRTDM